MNRGVWGWVCMMLIAGSAVAQTPATNKPTINQSDSVRVGNSVLTATADSVNRTSSDTVKLSEEKTAQIRKIIPRQATIRSLLVPGMGQAYNGQYWKIPFVYAGLGTEIYLIINFNQQYQKFESAYKEAYYDTSTGTNAKTAVVYVRGRGDLRLSVQQLKTATDAYHRYRDLNVILLAALWGLNAVEANVAAHLKTFDMSDDLSLQVRPVLIPTYAGIPVLGARLTLSIK